MSISRLALIMTFLLLTALRVHTDTADVGASSDARSAPPHRDAVMNDLFAVITLNGQHCEQVIDYEVIKDMDYVAICKNGQRYRIDVTPQGAVRVGPHKD
jgi:hypothetical protein